MYIDIGDEAKAALKSNAVTTTARITLTSNGQIIDGNNLINVTITDQCYENGVIVGTAMCKEVEIELLNNNFDLANQEFSLEVGVLLESDSYKYIPFGNFIVKEYQKIVSSNHYKLIAYDYMDKFNAPFTDLNDYSTPITLQTFYENLATSYGVNVQEQLNLPNADFIISAKPYFEEMSGRVVLSKIAEMMGCFAKINRENKLEMKLKNSTNERFSRNEMNTSLEINEKFGPINVVALRLSQIEGENITKRDEESISENGETALQIYDNPFVDTQDLRALAIDDIYDQIDGFSYYPTIFNAKLIYLDCGDEVEVQDMKTDNYYKTIILKQVIKIPSVTNSKFENKALTATALQYQFTPEQIRKDKRTEYLVDKNNQEIRQIIKSIGDRSEKGLSVTEEIEELTTSIEGVTNRLTENGGNNLFYYSKDFWVGGDVERYNYKSINIGDDLSGKTLAFNFPEGVYLGEESPINILKAASGYSITTDFTLDETTHRWMDDILVKENGTDTRIYRYDGTTHEIIDNYTEFTLSENFGAVTEITTLIPDIMQYIKIRETVIEEVLNIEEFTNTEIKTHSVSGRGYIVNEGSSYQDTLVTNMAVQNGIYTISFKYKKIGPQLSNVSVKINDVEYQLQETVWTEFSKTIDVTTNHIKIEFISDTDNVLYITDLLGNIGGQKRIWTQNPNETRTDTVTIGRGIEVRSSVSKTFTKIDTDGTRIFNINDTENPVAEFTSYGMKSKELRAEEQAQIAGLLFQKVGNQTWISSLL